MHACVTVWGCIDARAHMCRSGNISPAVMWGPGKQTQAVRLASGCLNWGSQHASPCFHSITPYSELRGNRSFLTERSSGWPEETGWATGSHCWIECYTFVMLCTWQATGQYLRLHSIIAPALKVKCGRITRRFVLRLYLIQSPFPYIPLQQDFLKTSVRYELVGLFSWFQFST